MNETTNVSSIEYFASVQDPIRLANEMMNKIRRYREGCTGNGLMSLWKKKLQNYYGISLNGNTSQRITSAGSEGELAFIKVNDLHSLIQGQLVIVTGQRPAGIARATKSDTKSLKSSRIGTAIAEYYLTRPDNAFETKFITAAEVALLCDESHIEIIWDKMGGYEYMADPETGKIEMSGDVDMAVHAPWNVARDLGLKIEAQKWKIVTYRIGKFDAAKKYEKFAQQILLAGKEAIPEIPFDLIPDGSDACFAHLLIHDKSPAVPNGRYSLMIGGVIVLDTELPFKDYPLQRMTPSDIIDGSFGYCAANDILAMEDVTDALHSVIVTNQATFGGQCLVGPEGSNIKQSDFGKGVRYFELPEHLIDKLKALDLVHTPPEIFNYINKLESKKEQAVGSNSVVRGQPEGQLAGASGSAFALIQSQAISFNSGTQRSYYMLLSAVMTKVIRTLQKYADAPMLAQIVGKSKASGIKEFQFTGEDLESISSVVYELVNPMSQTTGGKLTFAQDLLSAGQIKNPKEYLMVATTGQLDTLTDDDLADDLLILEENEWLIEGKPVKAIITQMHADHIRSHTSQITLEMIQSDGEAVQRILDHVQEHINIWTEASLTNPGILMATGQQPLLPPPGPEMPGNEGDVPQEEIAQGGPGDMAMSEPEEPNMPSLPNIAGTNQEPAIPGVTLQ